MSLKFRSFHDEQQSDGIPRSILKLLAIVQSEYDWFQNLIVGGILGSGSFGSVVMTTDNYGNETAVKILRIIPRALSSVGSKDGNTIIEDPSREYEHMKDIYHRNLVNLFQYKEIRLKVRTAEEIFHSVNTIFSKLLEGAVNEFIPLRLIEMELCGSTLGDWIKEVRDESKGIPNSGIFQFRIVMGLLEGLSFLHERNIIHRDLTPWNIFFSKNFALPVKIGDFGLCKQVTLPKTGIVNDSPMSKKGNETYAAPETEKGWVENSPKSLNHGKLADIFSLGLITWEASDPVNVFPHCFDDLLDGEGDEDIVKNHPLIINLRPLIIQMTKKDPEDRVLNLKSHNLQFGYPGTDIPITIESPSSEEFQLILDHCVGGSKIQLPNGIFKGPFISKRNRIQVIGSAKTVFESLEGPSTCIQLFGESSSIQDVLLRCDGDVACSLDLSGNGCSAKNITIEGGRISINVNADDCRIENVSIVPSEHGIHIFGSNAVVANTTIKNGYSGIIVNDLKNIQENEEVNNTCLDGITIEGCIIGLEIYGNRTKVKNALIQRGDFYWKMTSDSSDEETEKEVEEKQDKEENPQNEEQGDEKNDEEKGNEEDEPKLGIRLMASNCDFEDVRCTGYSFKKRRELGIKIKTKSSKNEIRKSTLDSVLVKGSSNFLTDVDGGEFIHVGSNGNGVGNSFTNCKAEIFKIQHSETLLEDCSGPVESSLIK